MVFLWILFLTLSGFYTGLTLWILFLTLVRYHGGWAKYVPSRKFVPSRSPTACIVFAVIYTVAAFACFMIAMWLAGKLGYGSTLGNALASVIFLLAAVIPTVLLAKLQLRRSSRLRRHGGGVL